MNFLVIYVSIALLLFYILKHELDIMSLIPTKSNVKMRNKVNAKQERLKLHIRLCLIWPILLIKEVYDEIQERRQS